MSRVGSPGSATPSARRRASPSRPRRFGHVEPPSRSGRGSTTPAAVTASRASAVTPVSDPTSTTSRATGTTRSAPPAASASTGPAVPGSPPPPGPTTTRTGAPVSNADWSATARSAVAEWDSARVPIATARRTSSTVPTWPDSRRESCQPPQAGSSPRASPVSARDLPGQHGQQPQAQHRQPGDDDGRGRGGQRVHRRRPGRVVAAQLHDRERPEPDEQHVEPRPGEQPHDPARLARAGAVAHPADPQRRGDDDDGREHGHRDDGPPQRCRRHGGRHTLPHRARDRPSGPRPSTAVAPAAPRPRCRAARRPGRRPWPAPRADASTPRGSASAGSRCRATTPAARRPRRGMPCRARRAARWA